MNLWQKIKNNKFICNIVINMLILRGIGFLFDIGGARHRPLFFLIIKK